MYHWPDYYERVKFDIPAPMKSAFETFLGRLPPAPKILDAGCGNCRFSLAMRDMRPDAAIDALDNNAGAKAHAEQFGFPFIDCDVKDFIADAYYNGIWAFGLLFFLKTEEIAQTLTNLADSLRTDGIMYFSMVETSAAATRCRFTGMDEADLRKAITHSGMEIIEWKKSVSPYRKDKVPVPTFYIMARNPA